jgi:hypothetical protein
MDLSGGSDLYIQIPHIQRVLLDEVPSGFDLVARQDAEEVVGGAVRKLERTAENKRDVVNYRASSLSEQRFKSGGSEVLVVGECLGDSQPTHDGE